MANFIKLAITRPGRIKNLAKLKGISTSAAAHQAARSSDSSLAAAGRLAVRFQKGGDLYRGGNDPLFPGSLKYSMPADRRDNVAMKREFKTNRAYPCS